MGKLVATLLLIVTVGCGSAPKPTVFVPPPPLPLRIQLIPQIAAAYTDTRIMCILPADVGEGKYVFGVSGMFRSEGPIDRIVYDRVIGMPCEQEPFQVYCGYRERDGKSKTVTLDVQPLGECR